jgi:hypothetical protein
MKWDTSADDVILLGNNTDAIKKNTGTVTAASSEAALEANAERTKYMLLPRQHSREQNHDIKIL